MVESELNKGEIVTKGTAEITKEDHEHVKKELGFKDKCTHIAIAGRSGTGKSSLINAFRGLKGDEDSAAPTDEIECTSSIDRYPDPQCPWIVWYDIPGGGTTEVPDAGYFEKQGLYVMDCIIVLWADRFTELDLEILKGARKWNITALIVRSKSELTLLNMATRGGKLHDKDLYDRNIPQARESYIAKSRKSIEDNLAKAQLESRFTAEDFFLVSAPNIQQLMIKSNNIPEAKEIEKEAREIEKEAKEIEKEAKEIEKEAKEIEKEAKEIEKEAKEIEKEAKEIEKEAKEIEKEENEIEKEAKEIEKEAKEIEKEAASSLGYGEAQVKIWWEKLQAAYERARKKIQTTPDFIDEEKLITRIFGSISETRYKK
ncbi:interferon-inducible GTPase-domain-containing protein [Kalaharituber pfeilii]|nr:interferon-inducible GTPase-domain-containing protein [Kalaharituber pfeilii]